MLPRQGRRRGGTDSARRMSMRPWQGPGTAPLAAFTASPATEVPVPGVRDTRAPGGRAPRRTGRGNRRGRHRPRESGRNPAIAGPLARPSPDSRDSAILMRLRRPRTPVRAPRGGPPRTVREVGLTSRTGPPPAGNGAAVSPSPLSPVQRADPRGTQPSPSPAGRARAHGRAHGHMPGARRRPARAPPERGPGGPHGQQSRHTDVCPLTVGMGRTTLCLLVFSTGGHIPRGSAICVCRRSTRVRTWGGIGTNAARRPR